jgi:hypothetical protein
MVLAEIIPALMPESNFREISKMAPQMKLQAELICRVRGSDIGSRRFT